MRQDLVVGRVGPKSWAGARLRVDILNFEDAIIVNNSYCSDVRNLRLRNDLLTVVSRARG